MLKWHVGWTLSIKPVWLLHIYKLGVLWIIKGIIKLADKFIEKISRARCIHTFVHWCIFIICSPNRNVISFKYLRWHKYIDWDCFPSHYKCYQSVFSLFCKNGFCIIANHRYCVWHQIAKAGVEDEFSHLTLNNMASQVHHMINWTIQKLLRSYLMLMQT